MGNLLRHGVDMYKQTINLKRESLPDDKRQVEILIKVGKTGKPADKPKESKYRRVAKFLILIGSEQASGILAELDPDQVSEISKEIALIKTITPEERDEIFAEFYELFSSRNIRTYSYSGSTHGGIETARRILYAAKGPKKGEAILNRAVPQSKTNLFSFLEEFSSDQLFMFFKDESDQTIALILSRLSAKLSAETIGKLPPNSKSSVLKRIAHQREVLPEVLEQVADAFREKVRHVSAGAKDVEIDGMQALAAILKQGDYSFGDRLINELSSEDPKIGKDLKEKLYTLDDVINTVDRPIQEKLKMMTDQEIAVLMKGRKKEFN